MGADASFLTGFSYTSMHFLGLFEDFGALLVWLCSPFGLPYLYAY